MSHLSRVVVQQCFFQRLLVLAAMVLATSVGGTSRAQDVAKPNQVPARTAELPYEVSWIGNTHGGGEGQKPNGDAHGTYHVQMDVDAIWVSPDGKVYANCQADEAHLQGGVYQDGQLVWSINIPWGGGGMAIAGDQASIYAAHGRGLVRYGRESGKPSGWKALDGKLVTGLTVAAAKLYASNYTDGKVHVFESEKEVAAFETRAPGAVAVDRAGVIYVAQFEDLWNQPKNRLDLDRNKVLRFAADGKALAPIVLEAESRPVALHVDRDNRLLVADNGPDCNIKIYGELDKTPVLVAGFGEEGGVYTGTPGLYAPGRFTKMSGIGTDDEGNLYVACNGQGPAREVGNKTHNDAGFTGTVIESYTPAGQRRWACHGLLFCDTADVDPASDGLDVYTAKQHFVMDYDKPAGRQWTLKGFLINPDKYPHDARVTAENTSKGMAFMRRIQGRLFLFTTGMYAGNLNVYRFNARTDGEVAIPCGRIGKGIWYDADGNGQPDEGETQPGNFGGWGLHIDSKGDVWSTANGITHIPCQGLDANGTPLYKPDATRTEPIPAPFRNLERIVYDDVRDVMVLGGNTPEASIKDWGLIGKVIARYDNWSKGNRTAAWTAELSTEVGMPKAMSIAGDYIFISFFHRGRSVVCHIHSARDGTLVGTLVPEGLGGVDKIGDSDMPYAIRAFKRSNGEYLVFLEDDRNAKNILFRWRPDTVKTVRAFHAAIRDEAAPVH